MDDRTADLSTRREPSPTRQTLAPGAESAGAPALAGVEAPGDTIGPYKILQLIGEGGFGNVYMAQQTHPVKRRVALKIVKPGMDTKQVIGRFEGERQALALMDHPNIAQVYDAGSTSTGRPYFVMELVKGVPITDYCDAGNLTTNERLRLFQDVCHAVQHAHHKGIVHRDLKPSNVLVTLHDERPVAKVIDFGIAKAMNQDLSDATVFTEFRQFIGTPEYMSPEQAAMSGLDVDTRSDVYSLGVLLYELLTGATPIEREKLRSATLPELQRIIREDEPPRPSTRLSKAASKAASKAGSRASGAASSPSAEGRPTAVGGGSTGAGEAPKATPHATKSSTRSQAEEIARHRRTDLRSLRSELAGDLDWIVMKCLEKDRTRRYQTAADLAEDIQHYLDHEPIDARPPSTIYTIRKFAQRHRLAFGVAGGVLSALMLTTVALGYGLVKAQHERDETARRETVARAEMLLATMNSVRQYTIKSVRPTIQDLQKATASDAGHYDDFRSEMVPGFSALQVARHFSSLEQYRDFHYREASPNPTNRNNKTDGFEQGLVDAFRADRTLKERSGVIDRGGVPTYYIARPMEVSDAKCLDCHTTPEMAPRRQVELYGTEGGYNWQMGDVIATQVVYVPVTRAFKAGTTDERVVFGVLGGVVLFAGLASMWMLRR